MNKVNKNHNYDNQSHKKDDSSESHMEHKDHKEHGSTEAHTTHQGHEAHEGHESHGSTGTKIKHGDHYDHKSHVHEKVFFSLILTIPVLLLSETTQLWLNFEITFNLQKELVFSLSSLIYFYRGLAPIIALKTGSSARNYCNDGALKPIN